MADTSTLFTVYGTPGDDFIIGTNGNDRLDGGDGSDQLLGLAGNDVLIGGSGFDNLDGGSGDDTYAFAAGDGVDVIWEGAGTPEAGGMSNDLRDSRLCRALLQVAPGFLSRYTCFTPLERIKS